MGFRFQNIRSADIPGEQRRLDQARETRRSQALDQVIGGLGAFERKQERGEAKELREIERAEDKSLKEDLTRRQRADQALGFVQKRAAQGISTSPEQSDVISESFQTGNIGGLTGLLGESAEANKLIADEKKAFKKSERALATTFKKAQISELQGRPEKARVLAETKIKAAKNKTISDVRKEISGLQVTKDVAIIDSALGKLDSSLKDATAAGDLAGVFSFMKILDPGSVVRESEFKTAANAAGLPERFGQMFEKVGKGTILTPRQRKDFTDIAKQLAAAQFETFKSATAPQRAFVEERGLPGEQIFPQFGVSAIPEELAQAEQLREQQFAQAQNAIFPAGFAQINTPEKGFSLDRPIIQSAQAGTLQEEISTPERIQQRQSRLQELRARAGQ